MPIVRAHDFARLNHSFRPANNAGHSTDKEVNGSVVSAKNSVASPFSMKEYTVIRSLLAVLKCGTKRLGAAAVGCVVATAGMLQGQSPESAPQLLPPSVQPTIAAPVTPTPATRQEGPVASSSVPIFDPMVKPASGCAGCGLPHRSGGGSGKSVE